MILVWQFFHIFSTSLGMEASMFKLLLRFVVIHLKGNLLPPGSVTFYEYIGRDFFFEISNQILSGRKKSTQVLCVSTKNILQIDFIFMEKKCKECQLAWEMIPSLCSYYQSSMLDLDQSHLYTLLSILIALSIWISLRAACYWWWKVCVGASWALGSSKWDPYYGPGAPWLFCSDREAFLVRQRGASVRSVDCLARWHVEIREETALTPAARQLMWSSKLWHIPSMTYSLRTRPSLWSLLALYSSQVRDAFRGTSSSKGLREYFTIPRCCTAESFG